MDTKFKIKLLIGTLMLFAGVLFSGEDIYGIEEDIVYTTDTLNIRREPDINSERVGILKPNSELYRTQKGDEWDTIIINDKEYYVHNNYLSKDPINENINKVDGISLGHYRLTAYCSCSLCCGEWSKIGKTSSGTVPSPYWTVACNTIPQGTKILINGCIYLVEDTGNISNDVIDIYMSSHYDALQFGVQQAEIFLVD